MARNRIYPYRLAACTESLTPFNVFNLKQSCAFSCQDDLECRKTGFFRLFKCMSPEEPGSGADIF